MRHTYITVTFLLLAAATAAAQYCPSDMPPADMVIAGEHVSMHDYIVGGETDEQLARVEVVTGGIRVNWLTDAPAWWLEPEPDAVYAWEEGYGAYCRHLSGGTDRTRLEWCATDCISTHAHIPGALVYQWVQWENGWRQVVAQMMLPQAQRIAPHSVAGRANHD